MADEKGYNGWSNYETWNVALWIDNEQDSQEEWQEHARDAYLAASSTSYSTRVEVAARALGELLKEDITDSAPDLGASMYSDLLGAALSEVNWDEIAAHWIEDVRADVDAEEADAAEEVADVE